MSIEVLADGLWAYRLGQASFALIFPLAGALLLGAGIYRRRTFNRRNHSDDERLLQYDDDPDEEFEPRLRDDYDPDFNEFGSEVAEHVQPPGNGTVLIAIGAVALALGAGHLFWYMSAPRSSPTASSVEVGQCIVAQAYQQGRMNSTPVDCARPDATMQLVANGDATASCPDGKRSGTKYPALTNDGRTQCFILNLRENHCYAIARTASDVNCADPNANVRVARRIDGAGEATRCPVQARMMVYPEPRRIYCLVAP